MPPPKLVGIAAVLLSLAAVTFPIASRVEGNTLLSASGLRHVFAGGGGAALAFAVGLRRRDERGSFTLAVAAVAGGLLPSVLVGGATPWMFVAAVWAVLVALPAVPLLRGVLRAARTRTLDDADRVLARAGIFVATTATPSLLLDLERQRVPLVGGFLIPASLGVLAFATWRRVERGRFVRSVLEGRSADFVVDEGSGSEAASVLLVGGAGDLVTIAERRPDRGDYREAARPLGRAAVPSFPIVPAWLDDAKVLFFSAACSAAISFGLLVFYEVRRSL